MKTALPNLPNARGHWSHFVMRITQPITHLPKRSAQKMLIASLSMAMAFPALAEQSQLPPSQTSLPNAFELVQKIEAQNREIARLASELEHLQTQLGDIESNDLSKTEFESRLQSELTRRDDTLRQQIEAGIETQVARQLQAYLSANNVSPNSPLSSPSNNSPYNSPNGLPASELDANKAVNRPFLPRPQRVDATTLTKTVPTTVLTNKDIPVPALQSSTTVPADDTNPNANTNVHIDANIAATVTRNPLTTTNPAAKVSQGDAAYAEAYLALQEEGADVAVRKMQTFIATYANHPRLPDAHYWLGEFELKQQPANVSAAEDNFKLVVGKYANNANNDKQSKALYRLATLAKSKGRVQRAKDYRNQLLSQYPESVEASLMQKLNW